jgi:hypothetical protein
MDILDDLTLNIVRDTQLARVGITFLTLQAKYADDNSISMVRKFSEGL